MATPAVREKYGPYYESAIWRQLPQREAVGKSPMTPSQVAGATYGELEARYQTVAERQRAAREWMKDRLAQRTQEKALAAQERGQAVSGAATLLGTGLKGYQLLKPKPSVLKGAPLQPRSETTLPQGVTPTEGPIPGVEPSLPGMEPGPLEGFEVGGREMLMQPAFEPTAVTPAITETTLPLELGAEATLGAETAAIGAETAAIGTEATVLGAETALATTGVGAETGLLASASVLGPIGIVIGAIGIGAMLLSGGKEG